MTQFSDDAPTVSDCGRAAGCCGVAAAQTPAPTSGRPRCRLLIHNAIVVDGNGTPASGPKDIVIENNLITDVIPLDPVASGAAAARRQVAGRRGDRRHRQVRAARA